MCGDGYQKSGTAYCLLCFVIFNCKITCYRNSNLWYWNIIPEAALEMYIYVDFSGIQWGMDSGEIWPMTERKAGEEIMMRLLVQSLKIVRGFHKSKLNFIFIFFSSIMQPKTLKLAAHERKVFFKFKGLKNIYLVNQSL